MLCCTVGWEWMASLCGCVMGCQMSQLMMMRTSHLGVWTILSQIMHTLHRQLVPDNVHTES